MVDHIPNADDLAQKGSNKRKRKQEEYEKSVTALKKSHATYQEIRDQRRIFLHLSRWYGWRFVFLMLSILILFSALPFYLMVVVSESSSNIEAAKGFNLFFTLPLLFCVAMYFVSIQMVIRKAKKEKAWIDQLLFKIEGYPDFLVYRSYPSFHVTFQFERKEPEVSYVLDVLANLPYDHTPEFEYVSDDTLDDILELVPPPIEDFDEVDDKPTLKEIMAGRRARGRKEVATFKIEICNEKASKFNRHRRWARRWFIKACNEHIAAIHQKYSIEKIIINNGTK